MLLCPPGLFLNSSDRFLGGLRLALDIDAPACQLGSQASVLPFFADGQGQLSIWHNHLGCSTLRYLYQTHARHLGRAQGVGDKHGRIGVPCHHVDLLTAQLVHQSLDANATDAYARANRVHAFLSGRNSHFGARAGFAGNSFDFHSAVEDLRDFDFHEPAQHALVGPRNDDFRSPGCLSDFLNVHPNALIAGIPFARHLICTRQQCLGLVQAHGNAVRIGILNGSLDDFAFSIGVRVVGCLSLRFANALQDNLLRSLGSDTPKILRGDVDFDQTADIGVRVDLLSFLDRYVGALILNFIDHGHLSEDTALASFGVHTYADVLGPGVRCFPVCRDHRCLKGVPDDVLRQTAL